MHWHAVIYETTYFSKWIRGRTLLEDYGMYYLKLIKISNDAVFQSYDRKYLLDFLVVYQIIPNQEKRMILTLSNGRNCLVFTILNLFWLNFRLGNRVKNYAQLGFCTCCMPLYTKRVQFFRSIIFENLVTL